MAGTARTPAGHWDAVFSSRAPTEVSWFQPRPDTSVRLLSAHVPPQGAVVDVGAGTSALVDALLAAGRTDVTLVDVSAAALDAVRERLGERAASVGLVVCDVLAWRPQRTYAAWHDRAVFHFLTAEQDRAAYVALAARAVEPGGVLVLGTFAEDGPTACSGLPTARYDAAALAHLFAPAFRLVAHEREEHRTPAGAVQPFTWVVLARRPDREAHDDVRG